MYVNTTSGVYAFDVAYIEFIDFTPVDYEILISKIPFKLMQNYPNPFSSINTNTKIEFELKKPGKTEVAIYNIKGQKVKTLLNENLKLGNHILLWNGNDEKGNKVASGIYLYKVEQNKKTKVKKMIVVR